MARAAASVAGALLTIVLACGTASAGDYAAREILGFSPDGRTFAFEEYGVQDGSGFPYSNIYAIDTATDGWVAGTPVRMLTESELAPLAKTRAEAARKARPILGVRKVGVPGNLVASNPPTEVSADPHRVVFLPRIIAPMGGPAYDLTLTEIAMPAAGCPDMGKPFHGFRLTLTGPGGSTQTLANDGQIPSSRHCPLNYAISDVLTYFPPGGQPVLAVLLSMFTVGFEGPDRRFLAVTAPLPQ
jgi:predicted secreted protein